MSVNASRSCSHCICSMILLDWKSSHYWYIWWTPVFCQTNLLPDFAEWHFYLNWMWDFHNFIMHWSSPEDITHNSNARRDTFQRLEIRIEVSWVEWSISSNITLMHSKLSYLYLEDGNKDLRIKFPCFLLFEVDFLNILKWGHCHFFWYSSLPHRMFLCWCLLLLEAVPSVFFLACFL